ncbi:hypothetical protein NP493_315g03009 [Ridgeia piscesae]|uniref:Guanine nucleotide-binding protein subunit gamma n=1 Tax=Ridgeia piscesae TaxID=27915 RepID=A0AAD9L500_RIDPI|nr:hypothetical protein NP493_315g03009 [Ridgeia piscesae]
MSSVAQQKKAVEQLRIECNMQRKPVSECVRDMVAYMEEHGSKDRLVLGFPNRKDNPYLEKSGCAIL